MADTEFVKLSLLAQTAYARLLDLLLTAEAGGPVHGSLVSKTIRASGLFRVLVSELPGEVTLAWKALCRRGKAWTDAAGASLRLLDPDLLAGLDRLGVKVAGRVST